MENTKRDIVSQLQKDILLWEGFKPPTAVTKKVPGLKAIEAAFPNGIFPIGAIHEFLTAQPEQAAATGGFIAGILSALMKQGSICLWIGTNRTLFPPALKAFGVEPHRIIFIDLRREREVLWVMEEALKCEGLAAVIAEVRELDFKQARRLQLAVESSKVTGFVLRSDPRKAGATACMARWQVTPVSSELKNGMPGVGFPRWQVELLKVRNGRPGKWIVEWSAGRFMLVNESTTTIQLQENIKKVS